MRIPAFVATRTRARLLVLTNMLLVLEVFGSATGQKPAGEKERRGNGRSLELATIADSTRIAVNNVILLLQDAGEIGSAGSSVAGGGFWKGLTNQYIFSSGANVGARIPDGTVVFANGGPFSELQAGSLRFPELDEYWNSDDPDDRAAYPGPCTIDAARIARFPALAQYAGEPFPGFADQTLCIAVNDYTGGPCGECAGTRAGVTIVETIFAFSVPTALDIVFATIRLYNDTKFLNISNAPNQPPGPYTLSDVIFAFAIDPDIGEAGDDQVTFLPDVQTMAFWDSDFTEPQFRGQPGFGGIGLVAVPVDPNTGEEILLAEFTVFTSGAPRPDPSTKEVWYALMEGRSPGHGGDRGAVLAVPPGDTRGMVSTAKFTLQPDQFVEMHAAYFFADVSGTPPAELLGEPYKNLATDELIPGANSHPAFDLLRRQARVASAVANAGFLQPVAPPSPEFTQVPGDRQITIVWDADPVTTPNLLAPFVRAPFDPESPQPTGIFLEPGDLVFFGGRFQTAAEAGIAGAEVTNAAFNPAFAVFDFEGFRVYRSRTLLANDAELIAQFDLANDIAGGEFCKAAEAVFDAGGNFIKNVCTETVVQAGPSGGFIDEAARFGTNTGLQFSVVDRGGSFPDPSNGPGLINGIPVAHAVTSFSVQCGILLPVIPPGTETMPPAACLSLESEKVFKNAIPATDPSSLVPATVAFEALEADGVACDETEPAYTVDPATGHFTDLLDCSNAIQATFAVNQPGHIPTAEFFFEIDKIETPCVPGPPPACYNFRAVGNTTVFYHWEKGDGSPATEMVPQSGTFSQHFELAHTSFAPVGARLDTNPSDVGSDLDIELTINWDNSVIEDLEVNGQSLHLEEHGGDHGGGGAFQAEARPHGIINSNLANFIQIGMRRAASPTPANVGNSREEHHPIAYSAGAASFELTWTVEGNNFSGRLRRLPGGQEVPHGGRPRGPDNPSTAGDFTAGYNWGFCAPGTPAQVGPCNNPPNAGPLVDTIQLALGQTFAIYVPSNSVYIEGLKELPKNGDKWVFRLEGNFRRGVPDPNGGVNGREPNFPTPPFSFVDENSTGGAGSIRQFSNVFPGARWKLRLSGESNELADADLTAIRVVPNPFIAKNEINRPRGLQYILFTHLPPVATIRIYTISGNLVRILNHTDGSGDEPFDVRSRYDLILASGNYYYHVTTPDGRTHLGRFAVIN